MYALGSVNRYTLCDARVTPVYVSSPYRNRHRSCLYIFNGWKKQPNTDSMLGRIIFVKGDGHECRKGRAMDSLPCQMAKKPREMTRAPNKTPSHNGKPYNRAKSVHFAIDFKTRAISCHPKTYIDGVNVPTFMRYVHMETMGMSNLKKCAERRDGRSNSARGCSTIKLRAGSSWITGTSDGTDRPHNPRCGQPMPSLCSSDLHRTR